MSLTWEASEGAEGVYYAHAGRYTARIVEGRVWRWQVGDDNEPARLSGRTTRGMSEAQEACAQAVWLLELSDAGADVEGLPSGEAVTHALVDDLRDQIGERDGVIAQLRASLDALQARYDERGAKVLQVIAENDALRATLKRYTDVYGDPDDSDRLTAEYAAAFSAGLRQEMAQIERDTPQIKVGDRVMWRTHNSDLVGTVTRTWDTPDGLACEVAGDAPKNVWTALAWALEVVK